MTDNLLPTDYQRTSKSEVVNKDMTYKDFLRWFNDPPNEEEARILFEDAMREGGYQPGQGLVQLQKVLATVYRKKINKKGGKE